MKTITALIMLSVCSLAFAGEFNLKYNDNSDNETGFALEVSIDGGEWVEVLTVDANVEEMSYDVPDDTNRETPFAFRVYAFNDFGKSGYTNTVETTIKDSTAPSDPNGLLRVRYVDNVIINAENVTINTTE